MGLVDDGLGVLRVDQRVGIVAQVDGVDDVLYGDGAAGGLEGLNARFTVGLRDRIEHALHHVAVARRLARVVKEQYVEPFSPFDRAVHAHQRAGGIAVDERIVALLGRAAQRAGAYVYQRIGARLICVFDGDLRDGGFRNRGFGDGGLRDWRFRDGGFRNGGFRNGGFRNGRLRDRRLRDGGFRDGGFRNGRLRDRRLGDRRRSRLVGRQQGFLVLRGDVGDVAHTHKALFPCREAGDEEPVDAVVAEEERVHE